MMLQATARAGEFGDVSEIRLGNTPKARWYNPETGTFLSVDPVVADAGDPQSFNAYSYARNNPVSYVDPDGLTPIYPGGLPELQSAFERGTQSENWPHRIVDPLTRLGHPLERKVQRQARQKQAKIQQLKEDLAELKLIGPIEAIGMLPIVGTSGIGVLTSLLSSRLGVWSADERRNEVRRLELELRALGEIPDDAWFDENGEPRDRREEEEPQPQRKDLKITVEDADASSAPSTPGLGPSMGMGGMGGLPGGTGGFGYFYAGSITDSLAPPPQGIVTIIDWPW